MAIFGHPGRLGGQDRDQTGPNLRPGVKEAGHCGPPLVIQSTHPCLALHLFTTFHYSADSPRLSASDSLFMKLVRLLKNVAKPSSVKQFMAKTFKGYYKTARTRVSFLYINWIKLNTCSHKNLHNGKCLIVSRLKMCTIRMLKHRQQNYPKANIYLFHHKYF